MQKRCTFWSEIKRKATKEGVRQSPNKNLCGEVDRRRIIGARGEDQEKERARSGQKGTMGDFKKVQN